MKAKRIYGELHGYNKLILLFSCLLVTILLGFGCSNGVTAPEADPNVILAEATKTFNSEESAALLEVSGNGIEYTFSSDSEKALSLNPGDIIVGAKDEGFLRKVVSVDKGSPGKVIVQTTGATLEEAVQKASFEISYILTPEDIREVECIHDDEMHRYGNVTTEGFYVELDDLVVYDLDGIPGTHFDQVTLSGSVNIDPRFSFSIDLDWFTLQKVSFINETKLVSEVKLRVPFEMEFCEDLELAKYSFAPIYFQAGPLPVVITPQLALTVGVDASAGASIEAEVTWEYTYKAGIEYKNEAWSLIKDTNSEFNWEPPGFSLGGHAMGYVGPKFKLMLYGVVGPYAIGKAYLEIEIDLFDDPVWELYAGLEVGVGVRIEVFTHKIADKEFPMAIGYRRLLDSGGAPWMGDGSMNPIGGSNVAAIIDVEPNYGSEGTPLEITVIFISGANLVSDVKVWSFREDLSNWQWPVFESAADLTNQSEDTWHVENIYYTTAEPAILRFYAITFTGEPVAVGDVAKDGGDQGLGLPPSPEYDGIP